MEPGEVTYSWSEIDAVREKAYAEGLKEGKQSYAKQLEILKKESKEVALLRTEWQTMIKMVQQHYLLIHDKTLVVQNDDSLFINHSNEPKLMVPADLDQFQEELARLVKMGRDFEIMLRGINDHAVLKGCWDKLIMTFKLIEQ